MSDQRLAYYHVHERQQRLALIAAPDDAAAIEIMQTLDTGILDQRPDPADEWTTTILATYPTVEQATVEFTQVAALQGSPPMDSLYLHILEHATASAESDPTAHETAHLAKRATKVLIDLLFYARRTGLLPDTYLLPQAARLNNYRSRIWTLEQEKIRTRRAARSAAKEALLHGPGEPLPGPGPDGRPALLAADAAGDAGGYVRAAG
jgi:hypothetical protein